MDQPGLQMPISINISSKEVGRYKAEDRSQDKSVPISSLQQKLKKITMFTEQDSPMKHNISKDDPFSSLFINEDKQSKPRTISPQKPPALKLNQTKKERETSSVRLSQPSVRDDDGSQSSDVED